MTRFGSLPPHKLSLDLAQVVQPLRLACQRIDTANYLLIPDWVRPTDRGSDSYTTSATNTVDATVFDMAFEERMFEALNYEMAGSIWNGLRFAYRITGTATAYLTSFKVSFEEYLAGAWTEVFTGTATLNWSTTSTSFIEEKRVTLLKLNAKYFKPAGRRVRYRFQITGRTSDSAVPSEYRMYFTRSAYDTWINYPLRRVW